MSRLLRYQLIAVLILGATNVIIAKPMTLPAKIQTHLTKTYPGWRQTATATNCIPKFQQSVISGDFDGDGSRDYAVKFIQGNRGYIIAFLARGADYRSYVLANTTAQDIKRIGLTVGRKGQRNEGEEGPVTILPNDAPLLGTCESEACYYVYRNGNFRCE
jgi:hypothetical protein